MLNYYRIKLDFQMYGLPFENDLMLTSKIFSYNNSGLNYYVLELYQDIISLLNLNQLLIHLNFQFIYSIFLY